MLDSAWDQVPLGQVATLQRGYDLPHRQRKRGSVPIVSSSGVTDTHAVSCVKGPGVVTGRYGTIGEVFYICKDFWPLNTTLFVSDFHENDPLFVSYLLRTIDYHSHSGKSGVPGVNRNDLHELKVKRPSLPEQRAIATALSDVDALLAKLDALIAKKRDIKQAAMQQLLTGKQRLPGFSEEWKVKRVRDLGEVTTGGTPSTQVRDYWGGTIPWITPTDILNTRDISSSIRGLTAKGLASIRTLPPDTLLVTCIASIGKNAILRCRGGCNQQINAIIPNTVSDVDFLYYIFENNKQLLLTNAGLTATSIVSKRRFSEIDFRIPLLEEQTAIAAVLSDMDAELAALETRRDKTRALKQGMMQELLTGRIRLV